MQILSVHKTLYDRYRSHSFSSMTDSKENHPAQGQLVVWWGVIGALAFRGSPPKSDKDFAGRTDAAVFYRPKRTIPGRKSILDGIDELLAIGREAKTSDELKVPRHERSRSITVRLRDKLIEEYPTQCLRLVAISCGGTHVFSDAHRDRIGYTLESVNLSVTT